MGATYEADASTYRDGSRTKLGDGAVLTQRSARSANVRHSS
jgi:hypothetical protein